jgi:hypothetical protein
VAQRLNNGESIHPDRYEKSEFVVLDVSLRRSFGGDDSIPGDGAIHGGDCPSGKKLYGHDCFG